MRRKLPFALTLIALALGLLAATSTATARHVDHGGHDSLRKVRAATSSFRFLVVAKAATYAELKDAAGIACIDNPGVGGMGIHYVNGTLVGDGAIHPLTPEALVYEPQPNGRLRLVAVEYVVFQDAWDAAHDDPPSLFGHEFHLVPAGNRYGLPPFYELHAWIWKHNPRGMHDDWNPRVSCPPA